MANLQLFEESPLHRGIERSERTEQHLRATAEARNNAQGGQQLAQEAREAETETHIDPQGATQRPAVATTPALAEAARPAEDEDSFDGVAARFTAAEDEHNRQRQQAATQERRRYMWIQFCEGVVRTIEQSNDSTAFTTHDLALTIINMKDLDEFMAERATESPTWRRILQTFPRLHTEMVTRFDDFRPLPSVNIDNRMELERLLASAKFDREMLHKARWYTRLSERVARAAATSNHNAARREAAASVDAALRAGAGSSFAMTRVRRL